MSTPLRASLYDSNWRMNDCAPTAEESAWVYDPAMCRSIRTLYNVEPPVTEEEVRAAALQFVRKISGYRTPSKANEATFHAAVEAITTISADLLHSLRTDAPPRNRAALVRPARQFPMQG